MPLWVAYAVGHKAKSKYVLEPQDKFVLGVFIWVVLSTAANGFTPSGVDSIYIYVRYLVVYFLLAFSLSGKHDLKIILRFIIFFGLLLTVEGIQQKWSVDGVGWAGQSLDWVDPAVLAAGGTGRTRWVGIFDGPGVFGVIYTNLLAILVAYSLFEKRRPNLVLYMSLIGMTGLAIYYCGSRGSMLASMAIVASALAFKYQVRMRTVLVALGLFVAAIMVAPAHLTTIHDQSNSSAGRVDMWVEGYEMLRYYPLFGVGSANFKAYTSSLQAHNTFIQVMGELGLPGLLMWLGMSYMAVKTLFLAFSKTSNPAEKALVVAPGLMLLSYHVSGFFVTLEYETFYIILACCRQRNFQLDSAAQFTKIDFRNLVLVFLGLSLLFQTFIQGYKLTS